MIYLASPFSHPDPAVRDERYEAVCRAAARLIKAGHNVFSPMAHSLPIAERGGLPEQDFEFWRKMDEEMISLSSKVVVLALPGWTESKGVQSEIEYAETMHKPIEYIES